MPQRLLYILLLIATVTAGVPVKDFLPFGVRAQDSRLPSADDFYIPVEIVERKNFSFFQQHYTRFYLNVNGAVTFNEGNGGYTPTCGSISSPTIMPFWADVNTKLGGSVYYRQTTEQALLSKASADVVGLFPRQNSTKFTWMFIATWENVPFYGAESSTYNCNGLDATNTFQMALLSDGRSSFAIFNFNKITWTTGTASQGDCNGLNGTPAKAGFDVGDGENLFSLPGSCTPDIAKVAQTSNCDQPGKWIFKIDDSFEELVAQEDTIKLEREAVLMVEQNSTNSIESTSEPVIELQAEDNQNITDVNTTCSLTCITCEGTEVNSTEPTKLDTYVTLFSQPNQTGNSIVLDFPRIDTCVEFWNPARVISNHLSSFNKVSKSAILPSGVCVRLYEGDCDRVHRLRTLDVNFNSNFVDNFESGNLRGISAVRRISCPTDAPTVTLYDSKDFGGSSVNLTSLREVGDCVELWNPYRYDVLISQDLRHFNDRSLSIKIWDADHCIRLYENQCGAPHGRTWDVCANNTKLSDLEAAGWSKVLSAVELIKNYPSPSTSDTEIQLYTEADYTGKLLVVNLPEEGSCVEFWNNNTNTSNQLDSKLRLYDDQARSVVLPNGTCVRFGDWDCDSNSRRHGQYLEIYPGCGYSSDSSDFIKSGFSKIASSVSRIPCPEFNPVTTITLHSEPKFKGNVVKINLPNLGSCVEFWSSNDTLNNRLDAKLKSFKNKARSVLLPDGVCVRLSDWDCIYEARPERPHLEVYPGYENNDDFTKAGFEQVTKSVVRIPCPNFNPTTTIKLHSGPEYKGKALKLSLPNEGSCVEFWNHNKVLNSHLDSKIRSYKNQPRSVELPEGICVRLVDWDCGWQDHPARKIIDVYPNSTYRSDFSLHNFGKIASCVLRIPCPSY